METKISYTLELSQDAYETLQAIAELATRIGYDRDEIDSIFHNVKISEPEAVNLEA